MRLMVHTLKDCYIFEEVEEINVIDETGLEAVQDPGINGWTIRERVKAKNKEEQENE